MPPAEAPRTAVQTLDPVKIARAAKSAGFTGADLVIAVAVALAESGGRAAEVSPPNTDGSRDYGLWQINGKAHAQLLDGGQQWWVPETNAAMARAVFNDAGGWSPWTTFSSGAYRGHMSRAELGAQVAGVGGHVMTGDPSLLEEIGAVTIDPLLAIGNALKGIAQAVFKGGVWAADPHNWARAAMVGVGGALIVGALVMVVKPAATKTVKAVM